MMSDPNTTDEGGSATTPEQAGVSRRRLVRWVAILAFAVPVVVELITFGGLIGETLLPETGDDGSASGGTDSESDGTDSGEVTATTETDAVGVGDELLPATAARETVRRSAILKTAERRTYVLQVEVENTTGKSVTLRLTSVRLSDGTTVEGISSTGAITSGDTGEVTGAWNLPPGTMPASVVVTALRDGDTVVSRAVPLERPPIKG